MHHRLPPRSAAALITLATLTITACGAFKSSPVGNPAATQPPPSSTSTSSPTETDPGSITSSLDTMDMPTTAVGTMDMATTDGTKPQANGYSLLLRKGTIGAGVATQLVFHITDPDGKAPDGFAVEQQKPLHLIVIRSDLTGYQHLHPTQAPNGTWSVHLTFPNGGKWHLIADFTPIRGGVVNQRTVLGDDLTVTGPGLDQPLAPVANTAEAGDGYTVTFQGDLNSGTESPLAFSIAKAGKPVTMLEPYLGAYGHLVALRQGDLSYTHLHPSKQAADGSMAGPTIEFMASVPTMATYRLFLQFQIGGTVYTAAFTTTAK